MLNIGFLSEENSVLGTYSDGALSMGSSANTVFAGVGLGFDIDEKLTVFSGVNVGYTLVDNTNNSLIKDVNGLVSGSAYLGLVKESVFTESDRFGLVAGIPLTTLSGTADFMLPVSRDIDGNIDYQELSVDLKNTAPRYTAQAFYNSRIDENQSVGFGIGAEFSQDSQTELVGMFKYKLNF